MNKIGKIVKKDALQLEYFCFGTGEEIIVCLHGHGRTASDFEFLESAERRVISIHLFFHGNSIFPDDRIENEPLRTSEFVELFNEILNQENVRSFHLLAFSQGGRFSLCLIPFFKDRLLSVTLIAPDGMNNQSFYNWSSRQKWARRLMQRFEKNPKKLFRLSNLALKLKLMRPKVKEFVHEFASNDVSLKQASQTWRAFRMILPDNDSIAKTLKDYQIPFKIIMGSYDQVIRPQQAYVFAKKINHANCVIEIQNGHNFFKKSSINKFIHLLPFMQH